MAIHISILSSPAKKDKRFTDSNKCIICRKVGKGRSDNSSCSGISTIEEIAGMLYNDTPLIWKTELQSTEEFLDKQPKWHKIVKRAG